jgi:cystathionine beta-lyase/cystathionine gamma-synthase
VVANFLRGERKVQKVFWPGFEDHPGHAVHKGQASGFGALISFDLGSLEAAKRFAPKLSLCSLGESLGGVETLVCHPAKMTHAGYTQPERDHLGITDGLVRISVGIEDANDIVKDPAAALAVV